jgi:hypothetical protein
MQLVKEENVWVVSWFKPTPYDSEGREYKVETEEFGTAQAAFCSVRESDPDHTAMISVTFVEKNVEAGRTITCDSYNAFARGGVLVPAPYFEGGPPAWLGVPARIQDEYKEAYDLRKEE